MSLHYTLLGFLAIAPSMVEVLTIFKQKEKEMCLRLKCNYRDLPIVALFVNSAQNNKVIVRFGSCYIVYYLYIQYLTT